MLDERKGVFVSFNHNFIRLGLVEVCIFWKNCGGIGGLRSIFYVSTLALLYILLFVKYWV